MAALLVALLAASCSSSDGEGAAGEDPGPEGWTRIAPRELQELLEADDDVYLVNVHVPYEGELPGTDAFIPFTEVAERADELPASGTLVLYCRSGNMSTQAAGDLVAGGRTGFLELEGGFNAWRDAGLPFVVDGS